MGFLGRAEQGRGGGWRFEGQYFSLDATIKALCTTRAVIFGLVQI